MENYQLAQLLERHGAPLLRYARFLLGGVGSEDAEDVVQEAFLRLWRAHPSFETEAHCYAWLLRVTGNLCRDQLKSARFRRTRRLPEDFDVPDPAQAPQGELIERERSRTLLHAVMALPIKYREPILLTYYEELPGAEAARILEINERTLRTRLRRAKARLEASLGALEEE